ncbi:hypothetical protein ACFLSY_01800 [Bacteroidota bacterium]
MVQFYDVREVAVTHLYILGDGEDFNWLRKNFDKFNLSSVDEAKTFIYCLGYIYDTYVSEAIKAKHTDRIQTIKEYCDYKDQITSDIQNIIEKNISDALKKILNTFHGAENLYREFASITIEFAVPHQDGYEYLKGMADKYGWKQSQDLFGFGKGGTTDF